MSFTSYLSPRAIWHLLVGRPPTDSELAEEFEARYRDTPLGRHLSRTTDAVETGTSSEGSDTILSEQVEGPLGSPVVGRETRQPDPIAGRKPRQPDSLTASTPAVHGTVVPGVEIEQPGLPE
eukprot:GHVT01028582.1.p2 GENE.GHVT01028582.1~~GHVT01028582.1.p2  ORF type:complete len:122 (+),score=5.71 GHVT01028582.1:578-943(+)